nr:SUMo-activating enzyme subunit 2 (SAE2) [Polytomella parva]|mmetsp:Transcript_34251/g.61792  ORF Transcript_34251/g.61792 Transcript_34251/m.61792 type:complete len:422 (-) Transcript_34251:303-1568(-)|eukprot:CAMPEP_0175071578 /NCGR_PEP_ID=MMETSP0052_2-20121109/19320_1 /TAXON_ID=51329 ORGANISM="Polytomella parva, Strain SAG 63-3" /NCGR_SAMPLE_ID=MMETSP0052_2 /ASSEMBLY_ACC=CAM_ASM_000194 /LENGTH=421 /DNA_ID=CAMNT_0016338763 /DNA_START=28 /DNA_END=1293 /DNA_ORIENTATION=+
MVNIPTQSETVKYVFVPSNPQDDIEELTVRIEKGKEVECLLDKMKAHFQREGERISGPDDAQRTAAKKQALLAQLGDKAPQVSEEMLSAALSMQMVETISMQVNNRESDYVAVNMYCDDHAQIKQLPLNPRASQIAEQCGQFIEVRGDVFFGRVFDNEDEFVRMNFTKADLSSNAPWVRIAQTQAYHRHERDQKEGGDYAKAFLNKINSSSTTSSTSSTSSSRGNGAKAGATVPNSVTIREMTAAENAKDDGNKAFKKGDWEEAIKHYSDAIVLEAKEEEKSEEGKNQEAKKTLGTVAVAAANNRALAYIKLGKLEEAITDCAAVLEAHPDNVKALLRRASCFETLGRDSDAARDLGTVLGIEPRNKEASEKLAKLSQQQMENFKHKQKEDRAKEMVTCEGGSEPALEKSSTASTMEVESN